MKAHARRLDLSRRVFLAGWGLLTLILVFVVIFLVTAVFKKEQAVAPESSKAMTASPAAMAPDTDESSAPQKDIVLFFSDSTATQLVPEARAIAFTDFTIENCRNALEALIHGPTGSSIAILPPSTKILGMYMLENGELVIDFSIELALELQKVRSATTECLLFAGIVNTVTQPALKGAKQPPVTQVRILIHGSVPRETFPAHVDVTAPLTPDSLRVPRAQG